MLSVAIAALMIQAAPGSEGLRCLYDTVGGERMQAYNAQLSDGTLSVDQFSVLVRPASQACKDRRAWVHQHQLNESWVYATNLAQFIDAGRQLRIGGVDPDAVLRQWQAMPLALRNALRNNGETYAGGSTQFVRDMRNFLVSQTPANVSPNIGRAFEFYGAYSLLLQGQERFDAPPPAAP